MDTVQESATLQENLPPEGNKLVEEISKITPPGANT